MDDKVYSTAEFEKIVLDKKITIIDFSATWCGPCRMMAPIFEECQEKFSDSMNFYKIDLDKNENLAARLEIQYVPTFVAFKNGEELKRISGYHPQDEFELFLKSLD